MGNTIIQQYKEQEVVQLDHITEEVNKEGMEEVDMVVDSIHKDKVITGKSFSSFHLPLRLYTGSL